MSALITLWSDFECAGGTRLATVPQYQGGEAEIRADAESALELVVPRDAAWLDSVDVLRVLRTELDNGLLFEWPIRDMVDGLMDDEPVAVIGADSVAAILRDKGHIGDEVSGGVTYFNLGGARQELTPGDYIDQFVLPTLTARGVSWVSRGTVDFTTPLDLAWYRWTPAQLMEALKQRTGGEWQLRRNGSAGYLLDLVSEINAGAGPLTGEGRNVLRIVRTRTRESMATSILTVGAQPSNSQERSGIGFAAWEVTGVAGSVVTLADRAGGAGPLMFDAQFVGNYLLRTDGTLTEIADSDATAQTVTVVDATGIAVGDDVEIRKDASGTLLTHLDKPGAPVIVGTHEVQDARGERNYTPNPFATDWATTPAASYAEVSGDHSNASPLNLKNVSPPDQAYSAGDLLYLYSSGIRIHRITADAVASGGAVTVQISPNASASDGTKVHAFHAPHPADDWSKLSALDRIMHREPDATTTITGTYASAPSGNAGAMLSLTSSSSELANVRAGDVLTDDTYGTAWVVTGPPFNGSVDGSGNVTYSVLIGDMPSSAAIGGAGAGWTITRPNLDALHYANVQTLNPQDPASPGTTVETPEIQTPPITVRAVDGLTLWARAAYTIRAGRAGYTIAAGGTFQPPVLTLRDTGASADLATATAEDVTLAKGEEAHVQLQASYALTADTAVAVRLRGIKWANGGSGPQATHDPLMFVRWVMVHLGVDGEVPPVWGSHATQLWQAGQLMLNERSSWAAQYEATVRELVERWGLNPAEPAMQAGGTIRLVSPSMGLDTTLRVLGVKYDLVDHAKTKLLLSTRRKGLPDILAGSDTRDLFTDVVVHTDAEGRARQTVISSERPPTVVGSRRAVASGGAVSMATLDSDTLGGGP